MLDPRDKQIASICKETRSRLSFELLVRVMLECACFSTWSWVFCDPTETVSPLGVVLVIYLVFSFRVSFGQSSRCKSVLVSISRFDVRIFDFLLELSLGPQLQSVIIILRVAKCRLLNIKLATRISLLPTCQLAACTDFPIYSRYVCQ